MTSTINLQGNIVPLSDIPDCTVAEFRETVINMANSGSRVSALFACGEARGTRLFAVLANNESSEISVTSTIITNGYPSMTNECPQLHLFERELAEQCNITPVGHPWLKPVRFPSSGKMNSATGSQAQCGTADFFRMSGEEIHEVAVGPIHAGIIEPGHFRFQCHGETVHHLEISLGYQHRGIEQVLSRGPDKKTLRCAETIAGDTTAGHSIAYSENIELLKGLRLSDRAQALRGISLELERMANHIGDLGALAGDIGFLPTMSYCGRIRGDVLNLTAVLCGNRFGRRLIRPGGVGYDVDDQMVQSMRESLTAVIRDVTSAVELLWETPSVLSRFEGTGTVSPEICARIGLTGPSARACGANADVRAQFPGGIYKMIHIPVSTCDTGDVFARAMVRWMEINRSATFILDLLSSLPQGDILCGNSDEPDMKEDHLAVSLVEGWRGEICHVAVSGRNHRFHCYKVVDPSFHNWFGLAYALRNQQISDFPLINKSFNLSYCGHDL